MKSIFLRHIEIPKFYLLFCTSKIKIQPKAQNELLNCFAFQPLLVSCPCRRTASLCLSLSSPYSTDGDGVSICAAAIVALLLLLRCYWIDLNTDCIIVRVSVFQGTLLLSPLLPLILSSILYLCINYFVCWNYLWVLFPISLYCLFSNYYLWFDFRAEFEGQTMIFHN